MWNEAGIERNESGLKDAVKKLEAVIKKLDCEPKTYLELELSNMAEVAKLIAHAALDRTESRGAHFRTDYPKTDDTHWNKHLVYKLGVNS